MGVIKVGDKIPDVALYELDSKVSLAAMSAGRRVVLFAVPGAFTPGCSKTHLPGYLSQAAQLRAQGVDELVCVSVNDTFVMEAWGAANEVNGTIRMLADPQAHFTKAVGLDTDLPPLGGVRSQRYSMLIEDGVVRKLNVEPDGTGLTCSLASRLIL